MTNLIGQSLGRYHILEALGQGGMATVYKAYDTRLERDVAIKVIRTDQFAPAVLERILKRFEREAKALARLTHPNIVHINDYGEHEGVPYLVMDYLPGGTLKQHLHQPMGWLEACRLLLPIAQALDYAHEQGLVHRDVKPGNILLTQKGLPMLTDFGIAKILEAEETATLTGTGIGVGTPEYMAPEQWTGNTSPQSDIYSLGVVLYEMITGRKPYTADTPAAILLKQAMDPLPHPHTFISDLPDVVEKMLIKALAKKPADRYQDMGEFVSALANTIDRQPLAASRNRPIQKDYTSETVEQFTASFDTQATIDQSLELSKPVQKTKIENSTSIPRWRSLLWIMLGWGISSALIGSGISRAFFWTITLTFDSTTTQFLVIGGAIGFLSLPLVLLSENIFWGWKNMLWLIAGWVIAGAITWVMIGRLSRGEIATQNSVAIAIASMLIIAGFGTVLALHKGRFLSGWKNVLWITLGWSIGGILGWAGFEIILGIENGILIRGEISFPNALAIASAFDGVIAGAICGAIMTWRLRKGNEQFTASFDTQATIEQGSELSIPVQKMKVERTKSISHWRSVLWITLGCAAGWAVGLPIIGAFNSTINDAILGYTIIGAISGFAIALVLRKEKLISGWKDVLFITSGWTIGWAIGMASLDRTSLPSNIIGAITSGAIGGFTTVLIILKKDIFSGWQNLLIILGWVIGTIVSWFIAAIVSFMIFNTISNFSPITSIVLAVVNLLSGAIGGAIGGSIGGAIMIWRLRSRNTS